MTAALGFRAGRGGAVVVAVAAGAGAPRLVLSSYLATAAAGDRLAYEPYHVAYELPRGPGGEPTQEAAAAVAEGRRRQADVAAKALANLLGTLAAAGQRPSVAALLINRAGWMTDLLPHALSHPAHPPVIEGLAVREALRFACRERGLPIVEMDEKTLIEAAAVKLGQSAGEIETALKALGAAAGKPWRKAQKEACLAAWVAATGR
ncbi:MAG TPA: hypothetical protein VN694_14225 [Caulobacteraceae bacterium]|nr:hypothetical protein [Caulobacteraceae bacterium]